MNNFVENWRCRFRARKRGCVTKGGSAGNPGRKVLAIQPLILSTPVQDIPGGDSTIHA
jgi:hypothetical protein